MKNVWTLAVILCASTAQASDPQYFYVKVSSVVEYPDGTRVSIERDKEVIIEGFTCEVTHEYPPKGKGVDTHWGPTLYCIAPGVGMLGVVARCNMLVPGDVNSSTLHLHSKDSPDGEVYARVTLGCETTYTRVPKTAPRKPAGRDSGA